MNKALLKRKIGAGVVFFAIIGLTTSCLNIKSKYPKLEYYKLVQTPTNSEVSAIKIEKNIFIKQFEISSDLATSKIVVSEDEKNIKIYNYHQWVVPLNELLSEYTITRLGNYGAFMKGIATSIYSSNPDIVLECKVLNCTINNSITSDKPNKVELSIAATLLTSDKQTLSYNPVFSKTYSKSLVRKDNSLESAVNALSILISEIDDEILIDINNK
jgi:ABC-type uncharacterized transport system auxiliary subunit